MTRISHIILGAGSGSRYGADRPKQFLPLEGRPVLARSVTVALDAMPGSTAVVVLPDDGFDHWRGYMSAVLPESGRLLYVRGGDTRTASVARALEALDRDGARPDIVTVHDGARPLLSAALLERVVQAALAPEASGAVPAVPVTDSLCAAAADGYEPVDRSRYLAVQTPQAFRYGLLREAYAAAAGASYTDDASLLSDRCARLGLPPVRIVPGDPRNIKITNPGDLAVAAAILAHCG